MAKSKVESWLEEMERDAAEPAPRAAQDDYALLPSGEDALSVLWSPQPNSQARRQTVEDVLLSLGKLEPDKLLQARSIQATSRGKKIAQILQEMAAASELDIQQAVAQVFGFPFHPLDPKKIDRRAFEYLPSDFMKSRGCCGLRLEAGKFTLGMVDPADIFLLEEVQTPRHLQDHPRRRRLPVPH